MKTIHNHNQKQNRINLKKLRVFKAQEYGFVKRGILAVNIERIWDEKKDENAFIIEFAKTYTHEILHVVMASLNLPYVEEEEMIRAMLNEEWDDELRQIYAENN